MPVFALQTIILRGNILLISSFEALERSASRQLQSTVCSFAETFPSSVVDAVFHAMIKEVNLSKYKGAYLLTHLTVETFSSKC